jgi:hypothetical protein
MNSKLKSFVNNIIGTEEDCECKTDEVDFEDHAPEWQIRYIEEQK